MKKDCMVRNGDVVCFVVYSTPTEVVNGFVVGSTFHLPKSKEDGKSMIYNYAHNSERGEREDSHVLAMPRVKITDELSDVFEALSALDHLTEGQVRDVLTHFFVQGFIAGSKAKAPKTKVVV